MSQHALGTAWSQSHSLTPRHSFPTSRVPSPQNGIGFDAALLARYVQIVQAKVTSLEGEIWRAAGQQFNVASHQQCSAVLHVSLGLKVDSRTQQIATQGNKTGIASTGDDVLRSMVAKNPHSCVPQLILDYRKMHKCAGMYEKMQEHQGRDSRVHARFHQTNTRTGRLSCSQPNLQQVHSDVVSVDLVESSSGGDGGGGEGSNSGGGGKLLGVSASSESSQLINIRSAFQSSRATVLIAADYRQMEMRILAHLCNDPNLIQLFRDGSKEGAGGRRGGGEGGDRGGGSGGGVGGNLLSGMSGWSSSAHGGGRGGGGGGGGGGRGGNTTNDAAVGNGSGGDIYSNIAASLRGGSGGGGGRGAPVTDDERNVAKKIVLAMMYGSGTAQLAKQLGRPSSVIVQMQQRFHNAYPRVKVFMNQQTQRCKQHGFVISVTGRRRYLRDIRSSQSAERATAERQAVNTVVQGSAGDVMKLAMIQLDNDLRRWWTEDCHARSLSSSSSSSFSSTSSFCSSASPSSSLHVPNEPRIVCQVHDELIVECPNSPRTVQAIAQIIQRCMEGIVGRLGINVPMPVKLTVGDTWGSMGTLEAYLNAHPGAGRGEAQ